MSIYENMDACSKDGVNKWDQMSVASQKQTEWKEKKKNRKNEIIEKKSNT